jgi:branched-chain amino acid transport system substrate-binding protein
MVHRKWKTLAAVMAVGLIAASCSSSSKSSQSSSLGSSGKNSGKTVTVGVITDLSGPGSNTGDTTEPGIKAGIGVAKEEGYNIKYVMADTTTSPVGALDAAKKLVQQDHVFAVLLISVVGFGAANYLAQQGIPVVGANVDGPEWLTQKNMFSIFGYEDYTKIQTTLGQFMKARGVTSLASLGYGIEPSSADVAKGWAISAQMQGIKTGYLNTQLPFGDTNFGPEAIAMKNNGVDGLITAIVTNSSFAIINALRQEGVQLKVAALPTGYGGDLTGGGPGAEQSAQGVYFTVGAEPVEMQTAATKKLMNALKNYGSVNTEPTLSEYLGYLAVDGVVTGLKAAGANPSQAQFINTMLGIDKYSAQGLYGGHTISFTMASRGQTAGADNCLWVVRFQGTTFHLVPGAEPLCGTQVAGKTINNS